MEMICANFTQSILCSDIIFANYTTSVEKSSDCSFASRRKIKRAVNLHLSNLSHAISNSNMVISFSFVSIHWLDHLFFNIFYFFSLRFFDVDVGVIAKDPSHVRPETISPHRNA